jgi:hypothetical protein
MDPKRARQWSLRPGFFDGCKDAHVLPLHEAVARDVPLHIVRELVEAYPAALQCKESSFQRLPLHCACRKNADPAVVKLLLLWDSNACLVPDSLGRVALHYALSNGADDTLVGLLLQYGPNASTVADIRGWLPLHVACSMGVSVDMIENLVHIYPESVHIRTVKGSDAIRTINKHCAHREELIVSVR